MRGRIAIAGGVLLLAARIAAAAGLVVEGAWIRTPPPGATMLAGYARLRNAGAAPIVVTGADGADFGSVSLHESISADGVERMRPLTELTIAPGATVLFAPGGRHFMLMRPTRALAAGDRARIHISTSSGDGATADFVVADAPP
jgi:copper(I)-binding protein